MKHLKKFNERKASYYIEVNSFRWDTSITETFVDFNIRLFKSLKYRLNDKYTLNKYIELVDEIEFEDNSNGDTCTINESSDEWFYIDYVFDNRTKWKYFKCDQEEGLLAFLKENKFIK